MGELVLPKTAAAFGADDFESVLVDELYEKENDLPVEQLSDTHGIPKVNELKIRNVVDDGDEIVVTIYVDFTMVQSTSCPGKNYEFPGAGELEIAIDKESAVSVVIVGEKYVPDSEY